MWSVRGMAGFMVARVVAARLAKNCWWLPDLQLLPVSLCFHEAVRDRIFDMTIWYCGHGPVSSLIPFQSIRGNLPESAVVSMPNSFRVDFHHWVVAVLRFAPRRRACE